jgi:hypothetical protein
MPIQQVPGFDLSYYLISYDKDGNERSADPGGVMSQVAARALRDQPITDVFITSHGWKGDVPAAVEQYDKWIGAMAGATADRTAIGQRRPGFKPLIIGFHWPSQPWGEEEFGMGAGSFSASGAGAAAGSAPASLEKVVDRFVNDYAERLADTPKARAAIRTIVERAMNGGPAGDSLPPEVTAAYATLNEEAGLGASGPGGDPGSDREAFDANRAYQNARRTASKIGPGTPGAGLSFAFPGLSGILSPPRQLTFWQMKSRGRKIGESAGFSLLTSLMKATPADRNVRFHLMGHSFGCIVASSMLNGPNGTGALPKPVASLMLVQGATSLWGFCDSIPHVNSPGYFRKLIEQKKIAGPIVTTQSKRDTAVGVFYPVAAGIALQTNFALGEFPKYGGLGSFGIQGPGLSIQDVAIADAAHVYGFQPGHVYNLECTSVIKDGGGASGAHSDIAKPEVAHAMWEAVSVA